MVMTGHRQGPELRNFRLNPCYNGNGHDVRGEKSGTWGAYSLNPCYNGNGHDSPKNCVRIVFVFCVLILVITEMVMTIVCCYGILLKN